MLKNFLQLLNNINLRQRRKNNETLQNSNDEKLK